jgi:hypothetical protein
MECYKNRGRFLIEAILWWLIIALPINLASIFFSIQAKLYIPSTINILKNLLVKAIWEDKK